MLGVVIMLDMVKNGCTVAGRFVVLVGFVVVVSVGLVVNAAFNEIDSLRLSPQSFSLSPDSSLPQDVQLLEQRSSLLGFDRDTSTEYTAFGNSQITLQLHQETEVSHIKVYGAAPYEISVQAWVSGSWHNVEGLQSLDLSSLTTLWHSFNVTSSVSTDQLKISFSSSTGGSASGLKELEIWGSGEIKTINTGANLLAALESDFPPMQARVYSATQAEGIIGNITGLIEKLDDNTFIVDLQEDMGSVKRAWLTYESHGAGHWVSTIRNINQQGSMGGRYRFASSAWSVQVEQINPAWLLKGNNSIEFSVPADNSYRVRNLKLLLELDNGSNLVDEITALPESINSTAQFAHDGDELSGWQPYGAALPNKTVPYLQLIFDKATQLDAISFYLENTLGGKIELDALENGEWSNAGVAAILGNKLVQGWNRIEIQRDTPVDGIKLLFINGAGSAGEIVEITPIGSGVGAQQSPPRIDVSYPDAGQYYGENAYIRGFVQPFDNGSGNVKTFIAGNEVTRVDGAFEALVNKSQFTQEDDGYSVTVDALYPDGAQLSKKVYLQDAYSASTANALLTTYAFGGNAPVQKEEVNLQAAISPVDIYRIEHDESVLQLSREALEENESPSTITIASLKHEDLPPLNPGMTNVTRGPRNGYRFSPHGKKFRKNIEVYVPYDKTKIPAGLTEEDIKTWYFDEEVGRWVPLERVEVNRKNREVKSHSDHFTDMINATLTAPDSPQAASFNPTQIKDIKAADPGAGVNLIEPPQANNMGDARLSYPIEIPAGRKGMQPQLAISYNSGGGNGWLGLGWDLSVPSISIDTRWGAPRYDTDKETETYMLNGEMLTPVAHRSDYDDLPDRSDNPAATKVFHTRVEGQFNRIVRHGNTPNTYWWEVTDKNGTRHLFGSTGSAKDSESTLGVDTDLVKGVFKWMLRKSIDTNGNIIDYEYALICDSGIGNGGNGDHDKTCDTGSGDDYIEPGYHLYPSNIYYTDHVSESGHGPYRIEFVRTPGVDDTRRSDVIIDARGGYKDVISELLHKIRVHGPEGLVRSYQLEFETGTFNKTRLISVLQKGADGEEDIFNSHHFAYYDEVPRSGNGYDVFVPQANSISTNDNISSRTFTGQVFNQTMVGGTYGSTTSYNGSFGVTGAFLATLASGNVRHSGSSSDSEGKVSLIDIDGDGKADKVFEDGGIRYRKNITPINGDVAFSTTVYDVVNLGKLQESKTDSSTDGFNGYAFGGTAFRQKIDTTSVEKSYLADVNGDGLVDLIDNGRVKFNYHNNSDSPECQLDQNGDICFGIDSAFTPNIIDGGAMDSTALFAGIGDIETDLKEKNPLMDAIKRWVAPYDGVIQISGSVQLHNFYEDPTLLEQELRARAKYAGDDGVLLAIQKNRVTEQSAGAGKELWRAKINGGDDKVYQYAELDNISIDLNNGLSQAESSLTAISVKRGDRLFFRVMSVDDGSYDRVNWSPNIVYLNDQQQPDAFEDVNLRNVYHYNSAEDMVYTGHVAGFSVTYDGTLAFKGEMSKPVTTDDITVRIDVFDYDKENKTHSETPRTGEGGSTSQTVSWDNDQPVTFNEIIIVKENDKIVIHYEIDSPVDLTQVIWSVPPQLYYTEASREAFELARPAVSTDDESVDPGDVEFPEDNTDIADIDLDTMVDLPEGLPSDRGFETIEVLDGEDNFILQLPVNHSADMYSGDNLEGRVQQPWKVSSEFDGELLITPWLTVVTSEQLCEVDEQYNYFGLARWYAQNFSHCSDIKETPDGEVFFTIKRRGELIAKHKIEILNQQVVASTMGYEALKLLHVDKNEELFFDFSARDPLLAERITQANVNAEYGSRTPWIAPFTDNVNVYVDSWVYFRDATEDDSIAGSQVMLVIRQGDQLLDSKIVTLSHSGTSARIIEEFNLNITSKDAISFDIFSADSDLYFIEKSSSIWARYPGAEAWQIQRSGEIAVTPVLSFSLPEQADGKVLARVYLNGHQVVARDYYLTNGVLGDSTATPGKVSPMVLPVVKDEFRQDSLRVEYWLYNHKTSTLLTNKGEFSVDYIDTQFWRVPDLTDYNDTRQNVDITINPSLIFNFADSQQQGEVDFSVWIGDQRLANQTFEITQGRLVAPKESITLTVRENDQLSFVFTTQGEVLLPDLVEHKVTVEFAGNSYDAGSVFNAQAIIKPVNKLHILMPRKLQVLPTQVSAYHVPFFDNIFGESNRGWGQVAYLANGDLANQKIEQGKLTLSTKQEDYSNYESDVYPAAPNFNELRWDSADGAWHVGAEYIQSTRRGLKSVKLPDPEQFQRGDTSIASAGIVRVPRMSRSQGYSNGGGYVLTYSHTRSTSKGWFDLIDLNGDRYPDIVNNSQVQYTYPNGRMGNLEPVNATRVTSSVDDTLSYGGGTSPPINPDGKFAKAKTESGNPDNVSISGSMGGGNSEGLVDYMDMNGDGLLDKVNTRDTGLFVGLNLGYRFAPMERWSTNKLALNDGSSLNFGLGAGWSAPGTTFSGGINLSLGVNNVSRRMMDMNSDGLADHVKVDGDYVAVALNLGGRFADYVRWGDPLHTVNSLDDLGNYGSLSFPTSTSSTTLSDGLSTTVSVSGNGTYGITLAPPFTVIDIVLAGGGSYGETVSQPTIGFNDINGDGFIDSIRSKGVNDLDVSLSKIGRTNLLKSVRRPLGAAFELKYQLVGKTFDYPQSKYVLNRVSLFDGTAEDTPGDDLNIGSDFRVYEYHYDGAKYDRYDREFLGFAGVLQKVLDTSNIHASSSQTDPITANQVALSAVNEVFRQVEDTYDNRSFYTRGLKLGSVTKAGDGSKYRDSQNLYKLRLLGDAATDSDLALNGADALSPEALAILLKAYTENAVTVFPYVATTVQGFYEGGEDGITTQSDYVYDDYGNVSTFTDHANANVTSDDAYATITYSHADSDCVSNHIVGLATTIEASNGETAAWERKRSADFDCSTGNLNWLEEYNSGDNSTARTDIHEYDDYGNIIEIEAAANEDDQRIKLIYSYDTQTNTYPVSIANDSYKLSSSGVYDLSFGQPLCTTDMNGNNMAYVYDSKGRVDKVVGPYELPEKWQCSEETARGLADVGSYTIQFNYSPYSNLKDADGNPTVRTHNWALTQHYDRDAEGVAKADGIETVLFTDGLKQVLQTKKDASIYNGTGSKPVMIVSGRSTRDAYGREVGQYYPTSYTKGLGDTDFITVVATQKTVTEYDVIDRAISVTLPDNTVTSMDYRIAGNRFIIRSTDANTNSKTSYRDVRQLITKVVEDLKAETGSQPGEIVTEYEYDFLKQIKKVTDAAGNKTLVDYDKRGRRTFISNLDTGEARMWYDPMGNLTRRQTANLAANLAEDGQSAPQYINYDYYFGRLTDIHYPNFAANDVHYEYGEDADKGLNQAGRIKFVTHQSGSELREYGRLGEITREIKTITAAAPGGGSSPVPTYETLYDFDTFGRLMRIVLPDGETLLHEYDTGGNVTRIEGRFNGQQYNYLEELYYDEFGQREFMALGNGIKTHYQYDPATRRLCRLQTGKTVQSVDGCESFVKDNTNGEVNAQLASLVDGKRSSANTGQFQNLHYAYDDVGNILGTANAVRITSQRELGGPAWQGYNYDSLYRLTGANGQFETRNGQYDSYSLAMAYSNIHNITHKDQQHTLQDASGAKSRTMRATSYKWDYAYGGSQPHAPDHIGNRTFSYDANGNQTGWDHDDNGTRRNIIWDDENRIQKIGDPGNTLEFAYDDTGERMMKRGQHGMSVYINQYFTVRNLALSSKHVFAGTSRIATKVEPGAPVGYREEPLSFTDTTAAETGVITTLEQTLDNVTDFFGLTDKSNNAKVKDSFPGQGLEHRSERANQVARNTEKNKHLNGGVAGGDHGSVNSRKGGVGSNNGNTNENNGADKTNNGNSENANANNGGGKKATYDYGGTFLYYYHPDHLGSTGYVTDADGELYEHIQYFPFGETWVQEAANTLQRVPYRFTSKELDEETGLYYYGARYYDPRTSVWQSVDPILGEYLKGMPTGGVFNPVTLGLYTYVNNKPLLYVDPNGLSSIAVAATKPTDKKGVTNFFKSNAKMQKADVSASVETGEGLLDVLKDNSSADDPITRLTIDSHGYVEGSDTGIPMTSNQGLYSSDDTENGQMFSNFKRSFSLGDGASLDDLADMIKSGDIVFADNAEVILFGCNLATGEFAQKFSKVTGANVIAAKDSKVSPVPGDANKASAYYRGGNWIQYKAGQVKKQSLGRIIKKTQTFNK